MNKDLTMISILYRIKNNCPNLPALFALGFLLVLNFKAYANLDMKACRTASSVTKDSATGKKTNPTAVIKNRDGAQEISVLNYDDGLKLFNHLKNPKYKIPYLEAEANCEARAHAISELLFKDYKISTVKVFLQSQDGATHGNTSEDSANYGATGASYLQGDDLNNISFTPTSPITGRRYSWDYHTAPALCINKNGTSELYILDPSLFNQPVTYSEWQKKVTSGLAKTDFSAYSTSMYNISRLEEQIKSPKYKNFEKGQSNQIRKQLRADWKSHTIIKASLKTAPKAEFDADAVE